MIQSDLKQICVPLRSVGRERPTFEFCGVGSGRVGRRRHVASRRPSSLLNSNLGRQILSQFRFLDPESLPEGSDSRSGVGGGHSQIKKKSKLHQNH